MNLTEMGEEIEKLKICKANLEFFVVDYSTRIEEATKRKMDYMEEIIRGHEEKFMKEKLSE